MTQFKNLFTHLTIGHTELKNRILSTAHQTNHVTDGIPTSDMLAYHEARAKGGVGLIILEAASVHPSGMLTSKTIAGYDQRIVDAYKELSETLHNMERRFSPSYFMAEGKSYRATIEMQHGRHPPFPACVSASCQNP